VSHCVAANMIRFERTKNLQLVASIMTHDALWPWISDDFYPAPEHFLPNADESIFYLIPFDGDEPLGVVITHPINTLLWEIHHALLPIAWGARARAIAEAFWLWLWENTHALKAVGFTPSSHRLAIRFAKQVGMQEVGRITKCYQRQFELHDIVIFEKPRPA
jgi:Protein of unknown function (DUF2824)